MKNIKLHKVIIEANEDGIFNKAILMYYVVDDSGLTDKKIKSISFNSEINIPVINILINKAMKLAKIMENKNA